MALSDKQIRELWEDYNPMQGIASFARAVEAEVQKQDTALIRQMFDALEVATTPLAADRQEVLRAVTAGRARLEGKP